MARHLGFAHLIWKVALVAKMDNDKIPNKAQVHFSVNSITIPQNNYTSDNLTSSSQLPMQRGGQHKDGFIHWQIQTAAEADKLHGQKSQGYVGGIVYMAFNLCLCFLSLHPFHIIVPDVFVAL